MDEEEPSSIFPHQNLILFVTREGIRNQNQSKTLSGRKVSGVDKQVIKQTKRNNAKNSGHFVLAHAQCPSVQTFEYKINV